MADMTMERSKEELGRLARDVIALNTPDAPVANSHCSDPTGYLNIFHQDGEYHLEMHVGVQSFELAYANDDYDSVAWYADQIVSAINKIGGKCRRYGKDNDKNRNTSDD